uniref:Multicopper oxidase n=1 Tax=Candidatus Criblamydia sequanensis CRIB-18 TaxID=1437425 RepID=A0A090D3F6_9BACT|nr:copper oxidase [Criblamydia sequanensis]CDR35299.1 Multicopper oxidase [Criblamydia sequanensis CRIB-18]
MKAYLTLLGLLTTCALYGQMDHDMSSPNSKMDQSNKPVVEPMQGDHSQMQGMDHSKMQNQNMPMNDQMDMSKDPKMQNMPMQDHKQMMQKDQLERNKQKGAKNEDQPQKGVLRYPSVITPNVGSLPWTMDGDVKVFHLIAEPIRREFAPGFWVNCWGYNGSTPGPTIEAIEGDRVRILVTNKLNEPTSVHWHGIILPNGMDGVAGLNQKAIPPGQTFKYEFTLKQNGTFMYHSHSDEMTQIAFGMEGFFIIHPQNGDDPPIDRDFAIFLHEWRVPMGAKTPIPFEMLDFNLFTFNSVLYPTTESLVVKTGDRVRIRFGNVMMNTHPIHIHGHEFLVTRKGGKRLPPAGQSSEVTVLVAPGETRDIEFIADNPGDWALHCHKSHHVMNQMQHDLPNLTGINKQGIEERIKQFFPDFMGLMNINGMGDMFEMYGTSEMMDMGFKMKYPLNLSPIGSPGPFGVIEMGGMFTIFKVRDNLTSYADPGWYQHPPGTVAEAVNMNGMQHNTMSQHNMNNMSQHNMGGMQHKNMQQDQMDHSMQTPHNMNTVSWFSQEEDKKERHGQEGVNWMQSKPEDSMGGHMQHGKGDMKGMSHDMSNTNEMNQMQNMGH